MPPTSRSRKIVIIGAGIVGISIAYFLAREGISATIIDAEGPSAGATGASDGAVSVASKQPGLMMSLAQKARALYEQMASEGTLARQYKSRPTFLIGRTPEEIDILDEHARDLESVGEQITILDRSRLRSLVSGVGEGAFGGVMVSRDGHALGYQVTERLLALSGAKPNRNLAVTGVLLSDSRATGVATAAGNIEADVVIVAAGLGSASLARLGNALFPRKGQLVITDRGDLGQSALAGHLMTAGYIAAKRSAAKPAPSPIGLVIDPLVTGQYLIGGTREDNRRDRGTDAATIAAILREAVALYPSLRARRVIRTFSGVRTASRDGLPIIGFHPAIQNLLIATGFEGDGICLGPMIGKIIANLVRGLPAGTDISALAPGRLLAQASAA
ncbi:FAD-binding oxidoreductase [Mesorhizobium sp. M0103]|uniref:NAD(P)/FAD-dependent oxidoreductase n=1 Tax=Mesorhizobium sp. M0103 TaxID=2956879 RepID=UPI003337F139